MTRTALVTGAGSGVGRTTARTFREAGWTVYATGPEEADLSGLAESGCETATLDVTSEGDAERVLDRIGAEQGAVDCLVNAAGVARYGPLEDVPTDRLAAQFEANAAGPHRLVRAALPNMRRAESGTIVNVSSVYGRLAPPGVGPYAASTAALEALSDALRAELDGLGIDVVVVVPGPTGADEDRTESLDGLERTREYEWVYETLEDAALTAGALPVTDDPEAVATVIHDAACAADPDPRYVVGPAAKALLYARYLPDRLRDAAFRALRTVA
ncbi:oxidoreductase [Halobacteriales archaeon QH_10_67_13]|nr:MAG: oxidoreductase [Halobacteriales archaeon QH_10_67_13]